MTTFHAVRLDVDGTLTCLDLPTDRDARRTALMEHVDGLAEIARYAGPTGLRLGVVVNENGIALELTPNLYATALVSSVRRALLPYPLCGPVVLTGLCGEGESAGEITAVPHDIHNELPGFVVALATRYSLAG
ncbi:hypothetical protein ACFYWS_20715 [Streptomyces sp. NPDC002795]|uniref:hypothetical protein n=1 Tax=Streptomyces sp. NPDC002795 TaxID=3364665 RepID=UPI00368833EA